MINSDKKIYANLGMEKCATTWIYNELIQHNEIDFPKYIIPKEHQWIWKCGNHLLDEYQSIMNFKFNLDFSTSLWSCDSDQLEAASKIITHTSIIFRDPTTWIRSKYYYNNITIPLWEFATFQKEIGFLDYEKTYLRLLKFFPDLEVYFYEDIVNNPQSVIDKICKFLKISSIKVNKDPINSTKYPTHAEHYYDEELLEKYNLFKKKINDLSNTKN